LDRLLQVGGQTFGPVLARPDVRAFWWPRFRRAAAWFVATERVRRANATLAGSEVEGVREFAAPAGRFTVTARADRIDRLHGGGLAIVDYKTGAPPTKTDIETGFAPQLAIEAVIAEAGGFPGIAAEPAAELAIWVLNGLRDGGEVKNPGVDVPAVVTATLAGLERLIAAFDDPAMPYLSRPRPDHGPKFPDYDHLARVQEWSAGPGAGDGQ
ncbi:MAG: PD-(D/E)XK nuclease family protein, partial [Proteobacteria bacterium]|nr:PD-(D/E)XK nuclease family protein [Pseudomonadota bacterium]